MAIFDIRSNLKVLSSFDALIDTNGDVFGNIVDNAENELGLMFAAYREADTDGVYTVSFQQSETGAFAGEETVVPEQNLIGDSIILTVSTPGNFEIETQGLFSTFRFIRPIITTTLVTVGTFVAMFSIQGAEESPVVDDVIGN